MRSLIGGSTAGGCIVTQGAQSGYSRVVTGDENSKRQEHKATKYYSMANQLVLQTDTAVHRVPLLMHVHSTLINHSQQRKTGYGCRCQP
jgi:hypothetical protein